MKLLVLAILLYAVHAGAQETVVLPTLVTGTAMTWTDGGDTWAGNPFCKKSGFLLKAGSAAIDKAQFVSGHHCPKPGSALDQPRMADPYNSFCREWYGQGIDIGACEFVTASNDPPLPGLPAPPSGLTVTE